MTWEVNITTTEQVVNTTVSSTNVVVTPPTNTSFNVTNNTFNVGVTNTNTVFDIYFDAVQLRLSDLNTFWRGEWVSGNEYIRGDIVSYNYSLFFLKDFDVDITAVYTSTIAPMVISTGVEQDTEHWQRLVWHEAPFDHIDVTNNADIGGTLNVVNNTTIGGTLGVTSTATIGGGLIIGGNGTIGGSVIINGQTTINNTATIEELILRKPMSQLTVTNLLTAGSLDIIGGGLTVNGSGLTVNTTATFNRSSVFNSTSTFNNKVNVNGSVNVTNSLTVVDLFADTIQIGGSSSGKQLYIKGNTLLDGQLDVTGRVNFFNTVTLSSTSTLSVNGIANFNNLRVNGTLDVYNTATFHNTNTFVKNIFVDNNLVAGDVYYPTDKGLNTQFLMTDGIGNASWQYLGVGTVWTLFTDLTTRGYSIKSGITDSIQNDLAIFTGGDPDDQSESPSDAKSRLVLGGTGNIDLRSAGTGTVTITANEIRNNATLVTLGNFNASGNGLVNETLSIKRVSKIGADPIEFLDSVDFVSPVEFQNYATFLYPTYFRNNILLAESNLYIQFSDGTKQYTAATGSGGGGGVTIENEGTVVLTTASVLNFVGAGVNASSPSAGRVTIEVTTGTQGIQGPQGPKGDTGNTGASGEGNINMTMDGRTNGWTVYSASGNTSTFLKLYSSGIYDFAELSGGKDVRLLNGVNNFSMVTTNSLATTGITSYAGGFTDINSRNETKISGNPVTLFSTSTISLEANTIRLTAPNLFIGTGTDIILPSDPVKIGVSNATSNLWVERIYNRSGDGPPLFPSGIRFADGTVQFTAFEPDSGELPPLINNIGTVVTASAENFDAVDATPAYFDAIVALDTQHVWVYTALGPIDGWFDASA